VYPMTHTHTHTQSPRVARVFEDIGGYYYCAEDLPYLDTRGRAFPSVASAIRSIRDGNTHRENPFTHYVRGNVKRKIGA